MDTMQITPSRLTGRVHIPPSKSAAHRLLLCAALSHGVSVLTPACHSADIDATIDAVRALGAAVEEKSGAFYVTGLDRAACAGRTAVIDCRESGSTLRFCIPVAAALGIQATFVGTGRLPERPIDALTRLLSAHGVSCSQSRLPLTLSGRLTPGELPVSGNISSQYLTGLLLALPLMDNAKIKLTTPLESGAYVDMTLAALRRFGVDCRVQNGCYTTSGSYSACTAEIEADWSQACFYLAAGAMGGRLTLLGLNAASAQGDKRATALFSGFGATVTPAGDALTVTGGQLHGQEIDCSQIPDMVPALAVAAALADGDTRLYGAARLRLKESDRIQTTLTGLRAFGFTAEELPDGMLIHGCPTRFSDVPEHRDPVEIDGAGDHRIVMAFAMLAAAANRVTHIHGCNAVSKSYPAFWADFRQIGGIADVIANR